MTAPAGSIAVIGIGNVLLRDDGIGVHVVDEMRRRAGCGEITLPEATRLVDGGTLGLALLAELEDARAVLFVDAADLGREPGAVEPVRGEALRSAAPTGAAARSGLAGLLAAAALAGVLPDGVALIGVQPQAIEAGIEPTAAARAAVPFAVEATLAELDRLAAERAAAFAPAGLLQHVGRRRPSPGVTA
jgi:hydrogenase maturation protease